MQWNTRVTVEALVEHDGRLLMIRHERDGVVHWEVPGGYAELGETLEEAAAREVVEETGMRVGVGALVAVRVMDAAYKGERSLDAVFLGRPLDPAAPFRPQADEGVLGVAWVDPDLLRVEDVHPMQRPLLSECWPHRHAAGSHPLFYLADQVLDETGRRTAVLRG
jgi:8-oxo-dGTP pyrophosphatase MutT (NUDIX family)